MLFRSKLRAHADCREKKSGYNLMLSKKRAISVKNYLIGRGISKERIVECEGVGDKEPVIICNNCEPPNSKKMEIKNRKGGQFCSEYEHYQNRNLQCIILKR